MKSLLRWLIFMALAVVGYAVGSQFPILTHKADRPPDRNKTSVSETRSKSSSAKGGTVRRDPRTGATFAESMDRLAEISSLPTPRLLDPGYERIGKLQFEVARIFALATREEMIGYFAGAETSERASFISSIAYARLAEFSTADAVELWTDQFHRTGDADGLDGLVEIWAKQDPSAAERWVDELRDPIAKNIALFALLKGAVESDPDLVERRLTEIEGIHEPSAVLHLLAWKLEASRFSPLADRLIAEKRATWSGQAHLGDLLMIWGKRDSAEMMAWLTKQPPGRVHDDILNLIAESRAKEDPAAFAREIGPLLADNPGLSEMAGHTWLEWLKSGDETEAAMAWFQKHGESIESDERHWGGWTEESAGRVLDHLTGLTDENQKAKLMLRVIRGLASANPQEALEKGRDLLPPGRETDRFFADTLSSLAWTDPSASLDWALENLNDGPGQRGAIRSVMDSWTQANPLAAMERTRSLPESLKPEVYRTIARVWTSETPDQALEHLRSSPDPEIQNYLAQATFSNLAAKRGGEAYLTEALNLPTDELKAEAVKGLFQGWSGSNAETAAAALQTFEPGRLRDIAIGEFVRKVEKVDSEAAFTWSLEIGEAAARRDAVLAQGMRWLSTDRAAATRRIESDETLPEEWRAELLSGAK